MMMMHKLVALSIILGLFVSHVQSANINNAPAPSPKLYNPPHYTPSPKASPTASPPTKTPTVAPATENVSAPVPSPASTPPNAASPVMSPVGAPPLVAETPEIAVSPSSSIPSSESPPSESPAMFPSTSSPPTSAPAILSPERAAAGPASDDVSGSESKYEVGLLLSGLSFWVALAL